MEGFRVLALGYKELESNLDLSTLTREQAESDIEFVGKLNFIKLNLKKLIKLNN